MRGRNRSKSGQAFLVKFSEQKKCLEAKWYGVIEGKNSTVTFFEAKNRKEAVEYFKQIARKSSGTLSYVGKLG